MTLRAISSIGGSSRPQQGMTLLATATPSGSTTFSFTNIPSTYKHLLIVYAGFTNSSGSGGIRFNGDTTAKYDNTYQYNRQTFNSVNNEFNATSILATSPNGPFSQNSGGSGSGEIMIYRYTDTTARFIRWQNVIWNGSAGSSSGLTIGLSTYRGSSAISSIEFVGGVAVSGTIYLYGVS
jgi:hypothetical protein